jgi:hypothetical protein
MVIRVPFTGDEKQSLQVSLDRHRDAVLWKLEGLGDDDLRRAMTPSGTNLLGLVKHLAAVEYGWFCETSAARSSWSSRRPAPPGSATRSRCAGC